MKPMLPLACKPAPTTSSFRQMPRIRLRKEESSSNRTELLNGVQLSSVPPPRSSPALAIYVYAPDPTSAPRATARRFGGLQAARCLVEHWLARSPETGIRLRLPGDVPGATLERGVNWRSRQGRASQP